MSGIGDIDAGLALLAFLVGATGLWYVVGTRANRRVGWNLLKWLREGTWAYGERAQTNWFGTSNFWFRIDPAKRPYRRFQITVLLEPRDMAFWGLFARLVLNRRDLFILRGDLRNPPRHELEIFDRIANVPAETRRRIRAEGWVVRKLPDLGLTVASPEEVGSVPDQLVAAIAPYTRRVWRLALRRTAPHLVLACHFPDPVRTAPAEFFGAIERLIDRAAPISAGDR